MKVSYDWLNRFFDKPLPAPEKLDDALTFHAFEIEERDERRMDVKVLPDRAAYALSHLGVAREIAAVLDVPIAHDPLKDPLPEWRATDELILSREDATLCPRYLGALVKGVSVGPSPDWLRDALEAVGQRSINNVVDATNFVMLNLGQPLHAFDAGKLDRVDGRYAIAVRGARAGEAMTTLSGEEYALPEGTLLITDAHRDQGIGIAGIKGGKAAEITTATTDVIIESANFEGSSVRRSAQALKLFTDASLRFQNKIAPTLADYGMAGVLALVKELAGGELAGVAVSGEPFPAEGERLAPLTVTLARLNGMLGTALESADVVRAFDRLGLSFVEEGESFIVTPPWERRDLRIPEDLAEEVGRIIGYDRIPSTPLPPPLAAPELGRFRGQERVRDFFFERGYAELSTPAFAKEGEVKLQNSLQADRPYLRASLLPNLSDALARAVQVAPRVVGTDSTVKLFELGNVFTAEGEFLVIGLGLARVSGKEKIEEMLKEHVATFEQELLGAAARARYSLDGSMVEINLSKANLEKLGEEYAPAKVALGPYRSFSVHPFALRDVAVWTPAETHEDQVASAIAGAAGDHLVRLDRFDRFEKDGRISYAFRLVFEAPDRTLSDADLDPAMERVAQALNAAPGFEVR